MDVRCERCKTEYEFDDARITHEGVTVKCTQCGYLFRVKKSADAPIPPPADAEAGDDRQWMIRRADGQVMRFKELTTLQRWIVERKVTREDEISRTGSVWKRLGGIAELASFFQVVENAQALGPSAPNSPAAQLQGSMAGLFEPGARPAEGGTAPLSPRAAAARQPTPAYGVAPQPMTGVPGPGATP